MRKIIFFVLGALMALPALARDIYYTYEGQGLTYTVISEKDRTVRTKRGEIQAGNQVSGDLVIPSTILYNGNVSYTVVEISFMAFYECAELTSVTIPNTIKEIDYCAFYGCSGLTSLTIPASVKEIGEFAFGGCKGLKSVIIPPNVTKIDKFAFGDCKGLVKSAYPSHLAKPFSNGVSVSYDPIDAIIEDGWIFGPKKSSVLFAPFSFEGEYIIPNSVKTIGPNAFRCCSRLTSVTIPNTIKEIDYCAFYGCSGLTSLTIPESVTGIGENAFWGCSRLTSVTIPESVTIIGPYAFNGCSALASVILPESLNLLGPYAFDNCTGLTAVYYAAKSPISADPWIFDVYESATLYVPAEAVEQCKLIDPWKNFKSIEALDFAGVEEVCGDIDMEAPYEVYSMQGVAVGNAIDGLPGGAYIIRQGNAVKKIAIK